LKIFGTEATQHCRGSLLCGRGSVRGMDFYGSYSDTYTSWLRLQLWPKPTPYLILEVTSSILVGGFLVIPWLWTATSI